MKARRKIIGGVLFFTLLFIGFFLFVLVPQVRGIIQDTQQLILQKEARANFVAEQNNLKDFTNFLAQHQGDIERFNSLFVDPQNPLNFLTFLEGIARESQFSLKIIPGNVQKVEGDLWPSIPFQISSQGSFENVRRFLQKLEYGPYLVEFKGVVLQQPKENTGKKNAASDLVDFTLSLKVYTQEK